MQNPYNDAFKHNRRGGRQRHQPSSISRPLPGQVAFRIVCHASLVGGVIGSSGSVVKQLCRETSSRIHFEEGVHGSDHRVILIIGSGSVDRMIRLSESESEECDVSCAQEAMIRVFERLWEVEAERDRAGAGASTGVACGRVEEEAYCGLLANTTQIGAVVGKGGKNVTSMRQLSGAKIRIMTAPSCARKDDELIQITGRTLAVKKALVAVSRCLLRCPPLDRDPLPSSRLTEPVVAEKASHEAFPDPYAELFPHLSSLLPPLLINSGSSASNACLPSMNIDGDPTLDKNGTWKEVIFRLLCSNAAAGAIIGKKGAIVRALQNLSGAAITFAAHVVRSGERVVTISAFEDLESWYSPAQTAVILVFARSIEADIDKGLLSGLSKGTSVTARLLVTSDIVSCLNGNGGQVLSEIIEVTGAHVQILEEDLVLDSVPQSVVVQITGEYKSVQDALFHVIGKLRDNFLPPDVVNEVRVRNPHGRVRETSPPGVHQQASLSLDTDQETFAPQGIDWGLSNNMYAAHSSKLQLEQQTGGRGHTMPIPDYERGVKTFGGSLEFERSMDYLLPVEVLNEVGGRSPYRGACRGVGDASTSGSHRSFSISLDSAQENVLARGMNHVGISDKISFPASQILQPQQSVGRKKASAGGRRGGEFESGKKSAIVKNTTVEIIVPEDVFGCVYGEDGCNLAHLRQISGAKVEVHNPRPGESEGTVVISGTPEQTQAAQSLLQAFILSYQ
ncbi:hypothetical protein SLEP1_g8440 [Rubroshorea leprosula]|uniref:K Homology domain-containing protein n=1 Tax=Rubroshorea leprosula TaxID=152421 RepID=A0AAV5I7S4_9ROSI|nr:hypothetical protein SLEP1_g8440 [Rubroshorea leprosula]